MRLHLALLLPAPAIRPTAAYLSKRYKGYNFARTGGVFCIRNAIAAAAPKLRRATAKLEISVKFAELWPRCFTPPRTLSRPGTTRTGGNHFFAFGGIMVPR